MAGRPFPKDKTKQPTKGRLNLKKRDTRKTCENFPSGRGKKHPPRAKPATIRGPDREDVLKKDIATARIYFRKRKNMFFEVRESGK